MSGNSFVTLIDAPEIEPKFRHTLIFDTFDNLNPGEFFELRNDHDPRPLYYQFMMERTETYSWEYLEEGPSLWRVAIGKV